MVKFKTRKKDKQVYPISEGSKTYKKTYDEPKAIQGTIRVFKYYDRGDGAVRWAFDTKTKKPGEKKWGYHDEGGFKTKAHAVEEARHMAGGYEEAERRTLPVVTLQQSSTIVKHFQKNMDYMYT